ncbi:Hypothetical protein FKW44_019272 [Caligus rogercresseyi]|uniref:Uncharacterized protein n=1 Tax=Caligus rogercresseyi TaxID=217165 RepID=A0A7T8GVK9_CALRO|nr:Hypothetical protein FKW44_019272 [Caligus rogercresseyi]
MKQLKGFQPQRGNEGNKQRVGGDQDEVPQDQLGKMKGTNKLEGIKLRFAMDQRFHR